MNKNNMTLIEFKNIYKKFGNFYALSNLNLEIKNNEILGFLGPNGAGKSTTMKILAQLLNPSSGEIWIRKEDELLKLTSKTRDYLLDNIGFLIETPVFYDNITPEMILSYFAKLKGYPRNKVKEHVKEVVRMVGLENWIDKKFKTFSKGMRQKIGILASIIHDPDVIVLDEPTVGLDPKSSKDIRDFILKLKNLGKTIFISSHLLYEISEIADRVAMISHGELVACDTIKNLEAVFKKSVIHLQFLDFKVENIDSILIKLHEIIEPLTGLEKSKSIIKYNSDIKFFEIFFDGDASNQYKILKALISNNFEVIDFSVPKAGLLENLYLDLVKQSDEDDLKQSKSKKSKRNN